LQSICKFIIYSNIHVVVVVSFLLWQTALILEWDAFLYSKKVLFVVFASLFLYPIHRLAGAINLPLELKQERHVYAEKYKKAILVVVLLSAFASIYFALSFSLKDFLLLTPLLLVSLAYSNPLKYFNTKLPALRDYLYIKTASIALVVSVVTVIFPFYDSVDTGKLISLTVSRFLFVYALTLPFDIRDRWLDKATGIKTFAVELGDEKLIKWALLINVLFSLSVFIQYFFFEHISFAVFIFFILSELLASMFIRKLSVARSDLWYAIAFEGMFVYQTIFIAIAVYFFG
jgi:4-hydroxybenzoate polyprenyltransferase